MPIRFDIITIFPRVFDAYFNESIIKRAREKKLINIHIHDLRKFSGDRHKKVDDKPYGGGPGMVFKIEPIVKAVEAILKTTPKSKKRNQKQVRNQTFKKKERVKIILFSPGGKQFNQKIAANFAKRYNRIVMLADRYEGFDERIKKIISDLGFRISDLSIGPYVLTGGELAAMVVIDAISRHIPGVLGRKESLEEKRHGIGIPSYTRPEVFKWKGKKYAAPKVLLSGNHKKIEEWRKMHRR